MSNDIICARCGKRLQSVEEARTHRCTDTEKAGAYHYVIRDESYKKLDESLSPLPKGKMGWNIPPPPAPPLITEEPTGPERPDSNSSLVTFIIWLSVAFIAGLAFIVWKYVAGS